MSSTQIYAVSAIIRLEMARRERETDELNIPSVAKEKVRKDLAAIQRRRLGRTR